MFGEGPIAGGDIGYFDVTFNGSTQSVVGIRAPLTPRDGITLPRFAVDANPQQGNPAEVKPVFHAFVLTGDANHPSEYVGPFRLLQERDDKSEFYLAWPTMEQTEAGLQAGAGKTWRFWEEVPQHFANEHQLQMIELTEANERKAKMGERNRAAQARQMEAAKQRDDRIKEINEGAAGADPNEHGPEDVNGLVNAIVSAENDRNQLLADVDDLRRRIHDAQELADQLIGETRALEQQLPQPTKTARDTNGRPVLQ
jgi:hypothetical protein